MWGWSDNMFNYWGVSISDGSITGDTISYKVKNYSDNRIEIYKEHYIYILDYDSFETGDSIVPIADSVKITTYLTYRNVEDNYELGE